MEETGRRLPVSGRGGSVTGDGCYSGTRDPWSGRAKPVLFTRCDADRSGRQLDPLYEGPKQNGEES